MTKFSIGDRVKIIKNEEDNRYYGKYLGKVGYIYQIDRDNVPYWISSSSNEEGEDFGSWGPSELELVKPKKAKKERCPECGKEFKDEERLNLHYKEQFLKMVKAGYSIPKKEKKAPECDCPGHKIPISPNDLTNRQTSMLARKATAQLLSLLRTRLLKAIPKEKDMFEPGAVQMWRDGYNSALSEVKKVIEAMR